MEGEELGAVIAAARDRMPVDTTHVVEIRMSTEGDRAYVLLAAEVVGVGWYLDETVCWRAEDGGRVGGDGAPAAAASSPPSRRKLPTSRLSG